MCFSSSYLFKGNFSPDPDKSLSFSSWRSKLIRSYQRASQKHSLKYIFPVTVPFSTRKQTAQVLLAPGSCLVSHQGWDPAPAKASTQRGAQRALRKQRDGELLPITYCANLLHSLAVLGGSGSQVCCFTPASQKIKPFSLGRPQVLSASPEVTGTHEIRRSLGTA